MVTIKEISALMNNDGLTLKSGNAITYKTGWQVATEGVECKTPDEVMESIKMYDGNCGIWFSDGIYYVDKSKRIETKKEALKIGRECKQISILRWRDMGLVYC